MIRAVISDFDGTLVETFEANYRAYNLAFQSVGLSISVEKYRECFGYRFDKFMLSNGILDSDISNRIREAKKELYPKFFEYLKPNYTLIEMIKFFRSIGVKTALASTARKENLFGALNFLGLSDLFDIVYSGVDVVQGKPSPEIYLKTMDALNVLPNETLIFEDSQVGIEAAKSSGSHYFVVDSRQFL